MTEITTDEKDEREDEDQEPHCEDLRHVFLPGELVCQCGHNDRRKRMAQ